MYRNCQIYVGKVYKNNLKYCGKAENVLPLDIKSGKAYTRHNALDNVLKDERYAIPQAFVFCNENISTQEKVTYLPIYMIGFLEKEKIEEYIYSIDLSTLQ